MNVPEKTASFAVALTSILPVITLLPSTDTSEVLSASNATFVKSPVTLATILVSLMAVFAAFLLLLDSV